MRRWTVRIVVFVLLGAIVNVAVAWSLAAFGGNIPLDRDALRVLPDDEARTYWIADVPMDWLILAQQTSSATQKWALGRETVIVVIDDPGSVSSSESSVTQRSCSVTHFAFGWPALSMNTRTLQIRNGTNIKSDCIDGWELGFIGRASGTLPTGVHVPGFAINTVFYAIIVWMVFFAPFALRRRRRVQRGLCVKCAYDLRGTTLATCPECGARRDSSTVQAEVGHDPTNGQNDHGNHNPRNRKIQDN